MRITFQIVLAAAGIAIACQSIAGPVDPAFNTPQFKTADAVEPASLDRYRGGFIDPNGFAVSLGIERIVNINGNIAATSKLNFGDLGSLANGSRTLSADAASQLNLLQNGGGTLNVQFGPGAVGGTVIQNSLNNQLINNATIINANVDARGLLQAMNFQSTLSNALTSAAAAR
jgi:hypothetical protein